MAETKSTGRKVERGIEGFLLASRWLQAPLYIGLVIVLDVIMLANLVVMVIISGYDNFVSRIELGPEGERLAWFGRLDSDSLKVKLATSVVVISAIHLLQRFLEPGDIDTAKLYGLVVMHLAFVATALLLAWTDRLSAGKGDGGHLARRRDRVAAQAVS